MLEKMFTTKMSMDKKKLQNRFSKIRSKNSKPANIIALVLFALIIVSIIGVSIYVAVNKLDGPILYKNEKMNVQFEIPESWRGKYFVDESLVNDGYIALKHTAIAEKYEGTGTICTIYKEPDETFESTINMLGNQTVVWQNEEYAYIVGRPTDVQYPIWDGADNEDAVLAEEYEAMSREITHIEKTFKLIKDIPVPVIENAENLSYMQIRDLQRQVNNGHFPWRLDCKQVIMAFLSGKGISVDNIRIPETNSDKLIYTDGGIEIELFKPIDKTDHGIWLVKSFVSNNRKIPTNISFYDTTPNENWIEKQEDGWYVLTTKTIVAVFPDVDNPISVTAYYTDSGTGMEDEKQQLSKITQPYTYRTNAKVLSMEVPFPKEDIHGHLWFEFEYENGEKITSEYFDVYMEAISDPPNNVTITDIGCEDIEDTDYIYDVFNYDNNGKDNKTISKKDGTISFYYKPDKKQNIKIKLVEAETGSVDAEYTIAPEPNKIYTFNGLKKDTLYDIVLERQDNKRIDAPVHIVYQRYGENITPAPAEIQGDDIGFSQTVFENDTSIKDIESRLEKSGKNYIVSDYSYKDNLSSTKSNIACDENGNISVFFDTNAENLVDVTFKDSATKKEIAKFGILASDVNSYSFTGFDKNKTYDVLINGKTGDSWKIEGQYIIF